MRRVLLDFDFSGQHVGMTVDGGSYEVTLEDGSTRAFQPGATVDGLPFRSAPVIGEGEGDQQLTVSFPLDVYDAWTLRDRAPLQLAVCRVYWWPEGEVLRDRHELFRGVAREPVWALSAAGGGSVSVRLVPPRWPDDVAFPPALVGDEGRFPSAPDEALQGAVPVIYGQVSGLPLVAVSDPTVNPVRLLIAGHRIRSTSVTLARGGATLGALPVGYDIDGRGGTYAYTVVTPAVYAAGSDIYALSVQGFADGSVLLDRLGDVMIHAFRTYAGGSWYELDRPRVEAARARLNAIGVAAYANDRSGGTVLAFLQQRLGGQFPVAFSAAGGRFGWDPVLLPRGAEVAPVATLTYGQDATERIGPSETSADDLLTDIELRYGYDGWAAGATAALRFSSDTSGDARRALSRWGRVPVLTVEAPDVADASSAHLLLTDLVLKRTRVRTRVEYQGADERFYDLPLAGVVLVTDEDLGWTREPCVIEAVEPRLDGLVNIVLVTLDGA